MSDATHTPTLSERHKGVIFREFWCWLTHWKSWTAEPLYHSYLMRCAKCGREWVFHD